jgi:hypothetical protein
MPNLPDTLDFDELGGSKVNYSDPADSTTDLDASFGNLTRVAVAAMSRTADRFWLKFSWNGSVVTLIDWDTCWGKNDAQQPIVVHPGSAGIFVVTLPATVTDDLGVSHSVNLRVGTPGIENSALQVSLEVNSPTTATFRCTTPSTGAATDPASGRAIVGVFK